MRKLICESCGAPAEVRLSDGSRWCIACDNSARRLGYDNHHGVLDSGARGLGWIVHNLFAHPLLILCPPFGRWLHDRTTP